MPLPAAIARWCRAVGLDGHVNEPRGHDVEDVAHRDAVVEPVDIRPREPERWRP